MQGMHGRAESDAHKKESIITCIQKNMAGVLEEIRNSDSKLMSCIKEKLRNVKKQMNKELIK